MAVKATNYKQEGNIALRSVCNFGLMIYGDIILKHNFIKSGF